MTNTITKEMKTMIMSSDVGPLYSTQFRIVVGTLKRLRAIRKGVAVKRLRCCRLIFSLKLRVACLVVISHKSSEFGA